MKLIEVNERERKSESERANERMKKKKALDETKSLKRRAHDTHRRDTVHVWVACCALVVVKSSISLSNRLYVRHHITGAFRIYLDLIYRLSSLKIYNQSHDRFICVLYLNRLSKSHAIFINFMEFIKLLCCQRQSAPLSFLNLIM